MKDRTGELWTWRNDPAVYLILKTRIFAEHIIHTLVSFEKNKFIVFDEYFEVNKNKFENVQNMKRIV